MLNDSSVKGEPALSALFFSWEILMTVAEGYGREDHCVGTPGGEARSTTLLASEARHAWKPTMRSPPHNTALRQHCAAEVPPTPHNNTNYERFNRNKHISNSKMHYYRCCWQSYGHLLQTRGLDILSCFCHAGETPDWQIHNW